MCLGTATVPALWFTLGPSTIDRIDDALLAGANGIRHTFSYATPELHIDRAKLVAARAAHLGVEVCAVADLPGEKYRLASFPGERIAVATGSQVRLGPRGTADVAGRTPVLPVQNERLLSSALPGSSVIVGDGGVELLVEGVAAGVLVCSVVRGGVIENNRGLTLVGGGRSISSLTAADLEMLQALAASEAFDAVAVSFVSEPSTLHVVREAVSGAGAAVAVVAKIETREGVDRIDEICAAADVVMAARGDLALAIDPAMLYAAVRRIAEAAAESGTPWVLATQLLEGLDQFGFPTRAELTDVVGWMEHGAAGAMLSRETVFGGCPLESIRHLRALLDAPREWPKN
jgi:pyruvate kinase